MKIPKKRYIVNLTSEEREELLKLTSKGEIKARKMRRAQILLKADEGLKDREIMEALNVSRPTVERIRKRYLEGGLEKALTEDPRSGQRRNGSHQPYDRHRHRPGHTLWAANEGQVG